MRPPCLLALFAAGAIKAAAQQAPAFSGSAPAKKIHCDRSGANFPASHIPQTGETKWTHNFMYPFKICLVAKGLDNVEVKCDHDGRAHLTLEVLPTGAKEHVQNNYNVALDKVTPSGTICHIFKVSEIVTNMAGKAPGGTKWGAHAIIFGKVKDPAKEAMTQVFAHVAPYRFEAPATLPAHKDHMEHGVVCSFADCKIEAIGTFDGTMTVERFKVEAGKVPTLEKGDGAVAANMFSVTLFECKAKDKCPTSFKAVKSSGAAPIAALYLSIGAALAVSFFVSEA